MKLFLYLFALLLLFIGCSSSPAPNDWQYKSSMAFDAYKLHYMKMEDALANESLKRATTYAKQSAEMTQLASIYLGECALHTATGEAMRCSRYEKIADLVSCPRVHNYALFINKEFDKIDVNYLDARYRAFARAMKKKEYALASKELLKIEDPTSMLLVLSLLGEHADTKSIEATLQKLSFYGYKRGVVHLLRVLESKTTDIKEKRRLQKKLEVLLQG